MAALGLLSGVSTVFEAMSSPTLAPLLQQLVKRDIAPMLRRHAVESGALPSSLVLALAAQLYLSHPAERARRAAAGVVPFTDDNGGVVHAHWLSHGAAVPDAHGTNVHVFVDQVLSDCLLWDRDLHDIEGLPSYLTESLQRLLNDGVQSLLPPALVTS